MTNLCIETKCHFYTHDQGRWEKKSALEFVVVMVGSRIYTDMSTSMGTHPTLKIDKEQEIPF